MRYALLIHYPQPPAISLTEEQIAEGKAAFHAYAEALDDAGVLRSAEVLQTVSNATSVSVKQGKLQVQDGPFADTKEAFAGIFMIDVPDLDAAIAWAEKCPAAQWGTIEIRPSGVRFVDGAWTSAS
ncbi:MAG TPA: YciI family protein [Gemmatimonadaceae bacterium]